MPSGLMANLNLIVKSLISCFIFSKLVQKLTAITLKYNV